MLQILLSSALGASLLVLGCTAKTEPGRASGAPLPTLVARRVTATVQREALRLVRLETEHEAFLTTPEHPFATPRSGWVSAGRLAPGDWVVSERFGAVRLLSVRSEPTAQAVPVFNLSVASSHAYFVGTDRVLVHNTKCTPNTSESHEEAIERISRARDELNGRIEELKNETPTSPLIAQLKVERDKLRNQLKYFRKAERKKQGVAPVPNVKRGRQQYEAENEAARKALQDARNELAELESRPPTSEAEEGAFAARKAELEKKITSLNLAYERTNLILTLLQKLEELEKDTPATDADRRELDKKKQKLRDDLSLERKRAGDVKHVRAKRADPEWRKGETENHRNQQRRLLRFPVYLADTERPRDPQELLEDELARWRREPPSERRDARIDHLTDLIDTMKKRVEVRHEYERARGRRWYAQRERKKLIAEGGDTRKLDEKIEKEERELRTIRIKQAELRVREFLLAQLDGTPWADAPAPVDEAQLREFERQLAGGSVDDEQLARIEAVLNAMDPTDAEQALLEESHDVDENLREWEELVRQSPSPQRTAGLESSTGSLERELREEHRAFEVAVSALVNEHAHIQNTQPSSSSATWQQRLRAVEAEMVQLRADRRAGLEKRLDSARRQLDLMRSIERFRDEAIEAVLARQIALLERELQDVGR